MRFWPWTLTLTLTSEKLTVKFGTDAERLCQITWKWDSHFFEKAHKERHKRTNKRTNKQTRSTQRAQTSAERQHNRIAEWFFLQCKLAMHNCTCSFDPDRDPERTPDSDADRHQNVHLISWSLGHTPAAVHKISSKSVGNFFDNPVNADFGLRTHGSERWSGSSPKFKPLGPCAMPYPSKKLRQNPFTTFSVIRRTDRQTDKQTKVKT